MLSFRFLSSVGASVKKVFSGSQEAPDQNNNNVPHSSHHAHSDLNPPSEVTVTSAEDRALFPETSAWLDAMGKQLKQKQRSPPMEAQAKHENGSVSYDDIRLQCRPYVRVDRLLPDLERVNHDDFSDDGSIKLELPETDDESVSSEGHTDAPLPPKRRPSLLSSDKKQSPKKEPLSSEISSSEIPYTSSEIPSTSSEIPSTSSEIPSTSSEIPSTSSEIPSTSSEIPSTSSGNSSARTNVSDEVHLEQIDLTQRNPVIELDDVSVLENRIRLKSLSTRSKAGTSGAGVKTENNFKPRVGLPYIVLVDVLETDGTPVATLTAKGKFKKREKKTPPTEPEPFVVPEEDKSYWKTYNLKPVKVCMTKLPL